MRGLSAALLLLAVSLPAVANAQPGAVDLSFGYRYMRATVRTPGLTTISTTAHGFPVGGEAGVVIRVAPLASLVATIGGSSSTAIVIPKGGVDALSSHPDTGTVTHSIADYMGGVKLSRTAPSPFVQVLAGFSTGWRTFSNVSSAGQVFATLDQGRGAHLTARAEAGFDIGNRGSRAAGHIAAGWDLVGTGDANTGLVTHFRLAAGMLIRIK